MKLSFNLIFQILATIAQVGNWATALVPPKYHAAVALIVGLAQSAVAWRAHHFNPDGTPAEKPYDETGNGMRLPRKGGDDGFLG